MQTQFNILVIDDNADDTAFITNVLSEQGYQLTAVKSAAAGIEHITSSLYHLVLFSNGISAVDAHKFFEQLKGQEDKSDIPVLFLLKAFDSGLATKALSLGAQDFISRPFSPDVLTTRVKTHVDLFNAKRLLKENKLELVEQNINTKGALEESHREMIYVLTDLMDAHALETNDSHISRMSRVASMLAQLHPELTEHDANVLLDATPMHDIGNLTLPVEVLHKEGKYTDAEYEQVKQHTTVGYNLLKKSNRPLMQSAAIIAHEHQEKWDGTGYPRGLKGQEIHIYGRIVAIADVFDALLKKRSYRDALSFAEAQAYIAEQKGKHFDPALVDIFIAHIEQFKRLYV